MHFTRDNFDKCEEWLGTFEDEVETMTRHYEFDEEFYKIVVRAYLKYLEHNGTNQALFRTMVLSLATGRLLHEMNQAADISDYSSYKSVFCLIYLYVAIEAYDKRGGDMSQAGVTVQIKQTLNDIGCSREFVRFVHQRNSCDCLQSAYNELKTTTQRTNMCNYCRGNKPINQVKQCSRCKLTMYCSRECLLAHYPEHKEECKWMQERLKYEMSTADK